MGDENKIYVGGLAPETTSESLSAHFSQYGEVADAIVMTDKFTGCSRGFGFVTFKDFSAASTAMSSQNFLDGREVSARKAVRENPANYVNAGTGNAVYNSVKIFVGGLPPNCDYDKFTQFFSQFGTIQDAVVMIDSATQRSRGFGYVTYTDGAAVDAALKNYSANQIEGKWVEVKRCIPQDKMAPGTSFKGAKGKGCGGKGFDGGKGKGSPGPYQANFGYQAYGPPATYTNYNAPAYGAYGAGPAYGNYGYRPGPY